MTRFYLGWLAMVAASCWGCAPSAEVEREAARPVDAEDSWLEVSDELDALSKAQERAEQADKDEYDRVIADVVAGRGYFYSDSIDVLEKHRDDSVPRLTELLASGVNSKSAASAAQLLCALRQSEGRSHLVEALGNAEASVRKQIVDGLNSGIVVESEARKAYREFLFADATLPRRLLEQLDDENPELVAAAVQACGILEVPGTQEQLLRLVDKPDVARRDRVMFWLSKGPLSRELLEKTKRASQFGRARERHDWDQSLFVAFARSEDPELRRAGRDELKQFLGSTRAIPEIGYSGSRLDVLQVLGETSREEDFAWLRQAAEQEHGLYAKPLVAAMIRLERPQGKPRLLQLLADPQKRSMAVELAGQIFSGTADVDIVAALKQVSANEHGPDVAKICSALLAIGGDAAEAQVERLLPRLDEVDAAEYRARLHEASKEQIKQQLVESGLLGAEAAEAALSEATKEKTRSPRLLDVLGCAKLLIFFDAEAGTLPCRHDQLLRDFASCSRGAFMPTAIVQQWHQKSAEDLDADYTLEFILNGRIYQGRLRNLGDWYDVERLVAMVNVALRDSGHRQRYVGLATSGQIAAFAFADPDILRPLAAEFDLPLSTDPNEAMRRGKEYEEKVFQRLQAGRATE